MVILTHWIGWPFIGKDLFKETQESDYLSPHFAEVRKCVKN